MKLVVKADKGQWVQATTDAERIMAKGLTSAMRELGKRAAAAANQEIHSSGLASKKWELKAKNFPISGNALDPAVWLHSTVNFENIFESGKFIVGDPYLWLPLPSVPLWPGDPTRQMSPKKYVQSVGPLVTMRRPGKPPMLGAVVTGRPKAQPFGRFASRTILKRGARVSGPKSTIPLFIAVRLASIKKKFDVLSAVQSVTEQMQGIYTQNESSN